MSRKHTSQADSSLNVQEKKAFDSVRFKFLMTTLDIFNFGEHFKEWIEVLLGMNEGTIFQTITVINENISRKKNDD